MNNAGIYGADRRTSGVAALAQSGARAAGFGSDPPPTAFVPHARWVAAREVRNAAHVVCAMRWCAMQHM